jgi:hypothetical protein
MKTLEQIQEENRKLIILANNPEAKSYEEALEMELDFGCKVVNIQKDILYRREETITYLDEGFYCFIEQYATNKDNIEDPKQYKILGKPLTLDKVLISLKNSEDGNGFSINVSGCLMHLGSSILRWDLTKPTLEQQSEETQREINKLLTHQ